MTALMMGIMEGIYIGKYGLLSKKSGQRLPFFYPAVFLMSLVLVEILWFGAYRPLWGEMEYLKYKKNMSVGNGKQAQQHIRKALYFDPKNTLYHIYAARLYLPMPPRKYRGREWIKPEMDVAQAGYHLNRAIVNFNGDVTAWSAHFSDGLYKYRKGGLLEARAAFKKAVYYNPKFKPAIEKLREVENIIEKHDRITINLR